MTPRTLAGLLSSIAVVACSRPQESQNVTATVTSAALVATQSFYGELISKKTLPIVAPRLPRVDTLIIKSVLPDGATVSKGDVVAELDSGDVEETLRASETDLAIAEADRRKVEQELLTEKLTLELEQKRHQMAVEEAKLRLVEGVNLVSELERRKAEVNRDSAEVELKLAESASAAFAKKRASALELADIRLKTAKDTVAENRTSIEKLLLRAPDNGVVYRPYVQLNFTRAKAEAGRVCRAGDRLIELPDLSALQAVLYMRPRDAARVRVGDSARVFVVSLADRMVAAKVSHKEEFATTRNERYGTKTPEGNLKEVAVTLELGEQPEGMRPGGSIRAEVESVLKASSVLVPLWALETERDGRGFVTLASGERRQVSVGLGNGTHGEVLTGVKAGDVLLVPSAVSSAGPAKAK